MVRYYGWYSNKSRGMRLKQGMVRPKDETLENDREVEIIDVSEFEPRKSINTKKDCPLTGSSVKIKSGLKSDFLSIIPIPLYQYWSFPCMMNPNMPNVVLSQGHVAIS